MIIDTIIGNVDYTDVGQYHIERVRLRSDDLLKRILRVKTDHGTELGILLEKNTELRAGDILHIEGANVIVVDVLPDEVLVIEPTSLRQMGELAHQIGNRHIPVQFDGESMLVQFDPLIEQLLIAREVPYERTMRTLQQAFRHIGHSHG